LSLVGPKAAGLLSADGARELLDELIIAFSAERVQAEMTRFAEQARKGGVQQAAERKAAVLLEIEKPIVAKYGFEASAKGVLDAMLEFSPAALQDPLLVRRLNHMESLLAAGNALDKYWSTSSMQHWRDLGHHRPCPVDRFPIIETEEERLVGDCVVERGPRKGILSKEDTEDLAAACKRGDVTKASQLLGARKVGPDADLVLVNLGHRGLGPSLGRTLGKALGKGIGHLELDVSGNRLGEEGIRALASGLTESLRVLKLNVASNQLGLAGMQALAGALPQGLEVLHLGLAGMKMGPEGAQALASGLPPRLKELSLDIAGNRVTDAGVAAISEALPRTLESLCVILTENLLSRRGLLAVDRQVGDPLNSLHLPLLRNENFKRVGEVEFNEEEDGRITRQLDFRSTF